MNRPVLCCLAAVLCLLSSVPDAFCGGVAGQELINNGQDRTRPLTRFDVRYEYSRLPHKTDQSIITFRVDKPVTLSPEWQALGRIDVPLVVGDMVMGDNPTGRTQFTSGEILTENYLAWLPNDRLGIAIGSQFIWPTAYFEQGGDGKYQFLPFVGARYFVPEVSRGSYILPSVQYVTDYAGSSSRPHIRQIKFAPTFHVILPEKYFFELYSSETMLYDFKARAWSIPANFMVGKMLTKNIIVSAEFFFPMFRTNKYEQDDFWVETRVGVFF